MTKRKHDNNLIIALAAVVIVFGITASAVLSIDSELKKRKASETRQDTIVPSLPNDYSGSEIENDSTETELPAPITEESAEENETSPADYSYVDNGVILLDPEDLITEESAESEQENPEATYSPDENDLPAIPLD